MCKFEFIFCLGLVLFSVASKGSAESFVFFYEPDRTLFSTIVNLTDDDNTITIKNIGNDDNFGFLTIGVHTLLENVTLSYLRYITYKDQVFGTNIGLYWDKNFGELNQDKENVTKTVSKAQLKENIAITKYDPVFYLFRNSETKYESTIAVYIVLSYYDSKAPIPGGCNLSFESMIAPYQKIFYNDDLITVMSQPPSTPDDALCNKILVDVQMYHHYFSLDLDDYSSYFVALEKMSSVKKIQQNGRLVPSLESGKYRRRYNSYKGAGEIFAIVASYNGFSSAYIPAVTFGCDVRRWQTDCHLTNVKWMTISSIFLLLGSFLCFFGHRFFKTSMFLVGSLSTSLVFYSVMLLDQTDFQSTDHFIMDLILLGVSVTVGIVWLAIWLIFQSPLINTHLTFFLANILMVSTVYFTGIADFSIIFTSDIVYWLSFACMMVSFLIIWITFSMHISHIITLSIIGSYLIIITVSFFLNGNLHYIIINMKRRLTVKDFNWAVISPPFNVVDLVLVIIGVGLAVIGFVIQYIHQKGKPAFILRRNRTTEPIVDERTPLLISSSTGSSGPVPPAYA